MDLFQKCVEFTAAREAMAAGLYPYFHQLQSGQDTEVVIDEKRVIMVGSNNYLGLTSDPRVKQAAAEALAKYGTGCSGSRFLNGNLDLHVELERRLAAFMRREAALVFSTGFQTNLGIISALAGKGDFILCDRQNHASIFDACRLSFAKTFKYEHNKMEELERLLQFVEGKGGILIVVDGVFSMEGDLADLPSICNLAGRYGARVMVDDAHGLGVLGANGRGTAEHFGLEDRVDVVMGTFSKSFASLGGFMCASESACHYVQHVSRPLIFSASMPPAAVAAAAKALEIIEKEPARRAHLLAMADRLRAGLRNLGFDVGNSITPVVPVVIGQDETVFLACKMLLDRGVYANPVISPATPPGRALIRTSLSATHTPEQVDRALAAFAAVGRELGLIAA
ncbi:MAG: aminotransferase class I/II-fold pyridoxal phosphate-dependent enzyme [Patescibacteria group bacterium]